MRDVRDTIREFNGTIHPVNTRIIYHDWLDHKGTFHYRSCVEISAMIESSETYQFLESLLIEKWIPECQVYMQGATVVG